MKVSSRIKLIIAFVLMFQSFFVFGQKSFESVRLKLYPMGLIHGEKTISLEYKFEDYYGIELTYSMDGRYRYRLFKTVQFYDLYKGNIYQIGLKKYFSEMRRNIAILDYVSLNGAIGKLSYDGSSLPEYMKNYGDYDSSFDIYHFKGISGKEFIFQHKYFIEVYGGVGLKYAIPSNEMIYGKKVVVVGDNLTVEHNDHIKRYYPTPTFHLGVKIGFHAKLYYSK